MALRFGAEVRAAAGNLVWKAASASLEKVCRLVLVIACAPVLGQAVFGRFQFATTVTTMLALGTELGLGIWTTRSLARSRAEADTIVATTLQLRVVAAGPYTVVTVVVALLVGPGETRSALLILGVSALASAFVDHFASILRGYERFAEEARLNTARALLVFGAGLGALWQGRTLPALALGVTAGTLASAVYGVLSLRRGGAHPRLFDRRVFDGARAREALRDGIPIWLAGMFSLLYFKGDTILMRWLAGDAELGAYSAAFKIFEGSQLIPAMLMAAAFPPLARAHGDLPRRRRWERLTGTILLALGLGVGLAFYLWRQAIVTALFGTGFTPAIPSLAALATGVPLMYFNCGLTHFLIARDLGRRNLVFAALMLPFNVGINLFAIPRWGGPGAAWATVATEVALTVCCLVALSGVERPRPAV